MTADARPPLELTPRDRAMLEGREGPARALAMKLIVRMGRMQGAPRLLDVTRAHVDSCLFHGIVGVDFAERLAEGGGEVVVPTTLNVSSLDLLHPDLFRGDPETAALARRLMDAYTAMGCEPTWTCAPYQLPERPAFGEQIAWAESNAIVFANSVLGARTERYGDFIDICAALTGRVPDTGLHREENRRGQVVFDFHGVPRRLLDEDAVYPVIGHLVGLDVGTKIPVLDGLPEAPAEVVEDRMKALGAASASSGSVAMVHAVGLTPEAPTLEAALQGGEPERVVEVTAGMLRDGRDQLTTRSSGRLTAVSLGTPHFSLAEFAALVPLLEGSRVHPDVEAYVSTGRDVAAEAGTRGWLDVLEEAGVQLVVDTCTYVTPILKDLDGVVMTNSGKWAFYAPGNLGLEVAFGTLEDCVRSAVAGEIVRDDEVWGG